MFQFLYFTQLSAVLLLLLTVIVVYIIYNSIERKSAEETADCLPQPPTPRGLPIIGHLHLLGGYEVPYQAFSALGKKYGNVIGLKLGTVKSVIVNGQESIREILVTKGHHFDNRPNFERYQHLFGGNKENSLAFCNWSETQRTRREILRAYTFPRAFTNKFISLEEIVNIETDKMLSQLSSNNVTFKPLLLQSCANIFTGHFCSRKFTYDNKNFAQMVDNFDGVFYEVNQGYAADFLPFLLPLHYKNIAKMNNLAHSIRKFIEEDIIGDRYNTFSDDEPSDFVESLIKHVKHTEDSKMDWDMALFALEDIIGGHSAIGNFLMKLLAYIVNEPEVQRKIQMEIDSVTLEGSSFRKVCLSDRSACPYTEGAIFEAIRLIASPIVPRVANQDTSVNGFRIKKDTLVFLNNYDLSMSEKLWDEPEKFLPERFVVDNHVVKPEHFLPFGGGRRSCMGYKMVQLVSFGILASLLQQFTIQPLPNEQYKVPIGNLALPKDTFSFKFVRRNL
ncbi:cytochrome P450 307a1-like [Agrilus planipennis]|uniref:Cytochrome P450 307a1-like n=1 Tax=Agrilus planipennis TaxID=224129 RepID=A0A1W4XJS9_AGRPL|nr:cytochrome P450 307a1-like [Agrilus planipennis]